MTSPDTHGLDPDAFGTDKDQSIEIDAICDAFERGVEETFSQAVERELLNAYDPEAE